MFEGACTAIANEHKDREGWLEARRSLLTASDIPAIMGFSRFKGPLAVYVDKTSEHPPERPSFEYQHWGHALEPVIARAYVEHSTRSCLKCGREWSWDGELPARWEDINGLFHRAGRRAPQCVECRRAVKPRKVTACGTLYQAADCHLSPLALGATPDYVVDHPLKARPGPLQLKTDRYAERYDEGLPRDVLYQVETEMMVTGASWGSVATLIGGQRFLWVDVEASGNRQHEILTAASLFCEHVYNEVPPPPTIGPLASIKRALAHLYPEQVPKTRIFLSGREWVEKAARLDEIKAEQDALKNERGLLEVAFRSEAKDREVVSLDDGSYFTVKRQAIPERTTTTKAHEYRALRHWRD